MNSLPNDTGVIEMHIDGNDIKMAVWNKQSIEVAVNALNILAEKWGLILSVEETEKDKP